MSEKAILCVDDDETILNSLGEQLKRSFGDDYAIELIDNSLEVLDVFAELLAEDLEIPLIISDQNMSLMSGDKLLVELHQQYPETLKILLTGQADADAIGNLVNSGTLYRYIAKPWQETDLILTVKEALRRHEQEQQLAQQNELLIAANAGLEQSLSLLVATLEATADGILVLDERSNVVRYNQKFLDLWGISQTISSTEQKNEILSLACTRLTQPDAYCFQQLTVSKRETNYELLELKNGKIIECYAQVQHLQDKNLGLVWSFRDVTERQKAEQLVKHQAFHDALTGLPNRTYFDRQLKAALTAIRQSEGILAVMFFDLDRFKTINDTLGHEMGDLLLKRVVERLLKCVRERDVIARWGGDEFTLLLPQISDRQAATAVANRILEILQPAFNLEGHQLRVTSSIGIAVYPDDGEDAETLLKNADVALYQAKYEGRNNYQHYNLDLNFQAKERLALDHRLYDALEQEEFVLHYQPIIDVQKGKIVKMEALLRWQHPKMGLVPPDVFIPLAEENGAILAIGEWVLQQACAQNSSWQKMGLTSLCMSVNLSPRQFKQHDLVSIVANILAKTELPPSSLELEVTETVTIQNGNTAKTLLDQFHQMGISLAMDDFGTGYSSLSYLKQFAFKTIKIDRSFVQKALDNNADMAIIKAIVDLGFALGIEVVAEGVETRELKDFLQNLNCQYMQGYYFSKPLSATKATVLLQNY